MSLCNNAYASDWGVVGSRLFIIMLRLPASEIFRKSRGNMINHTFEDVRTGQQVTMLPEVLDVNDHHITYFSAEYTCHKVEHHSSQIASWESTTIECDFPNTRIHPSSCFSLHSRKYGLVCERLCFGEGMFGDIANSPGPRNRTVACVSGVNYWSPHWLNMAMMNIKAGFDHVYFSIKYLRKDAMYKYIEAKIQEFHMMDYVTLVPSVYSRKVISLNRGVDCNKFSNVCDYSLSGHKSAYYNSCLIKFWERGDFAVATMDFDEVMYPLPDVPPDACAITCQKKSHSVFWPPPLNASHRMQLEISSVNTYGKTLHILGKSKRCGVHISATLSTSCKQYTDREKCNLLHFTNMHRIRSRINPKKAIGCPSELFAPDLTLPRITR